MYLMACIEAYSAVSTILCSHPSIFADSLYTIQVYTQPFRLRRFTLQPWTELAYLK